MLASRHPNGTKTPQNIHFARVANIAVEMMMIMIATARIAAWQLLKHGVYDVFPVKKNMAFEIRTSKKKKKCMF